MQIKKQSKIGLIYPKKGISKFGSGFLKDYNANVSNFASIYDLLKSRNIIFDIIESEEQIQGHDIIFSPGEINFELKKSTLNKLFKNGGIFFGLGNQEFPEKEFEEIFGLNKEQNIKNNDFSINPLEITLDYKDIPKEYSLITLYSLHPFKLKKSNCTPIISILEKNIYSSVKNHKSGKAFYFYDLGLGIFLRYLECTHLNKKFNLSNKGLDDLEPLFWTILREVIIEKDGFIVHSSISPKVKSFSIAHDTESLDCVKTGRKISSLNKSFNITPTWYLRTKSKYRYDGSNFLYTKPFILNNPNYSFKDVKKYFNPEEVGLHSEQFNWIKINKKDINPDEEYSKSLNYLRNESGKKVRSGSMHFGNYAEIYPEDQISLSKCGVRLWRNSYRNNGITPFRPYSLFNENLNIIPSWGYSDNIIDDFVALNLSKFDLKNKFEKNMFWLDFFYPLSSTLGEL
jgi:hypothetical protein